MASRAGWRLRWSPAVIVAVQRDYITVRKNRLHLLKFPRR
jgi:hypothetical protein